MFTVISLYDLIMFDFKTRNSPRQVFNVKIYEVFIQLTSKLIDINKNVELYQKVLKLVIKLEQKFEIPTDI